MVSTRNPSGLSQIVLNNTISALGGLQGYLSWIISVRNEYLKRKNALVLALQHSEAVKKGWAYVNDAECGMFVTFVVNADHVDDKHEFMMNEFRLATAQTGVLTVSGGNLSISDVAKKERANFVRISLASAPDLKTLEEAAKRLSDAVVLLHKDE
ncbi:unnamed protein product [Ambrosiozyma monospora]|uniref:Unnamed protein product n=1 Tax=Ambrosiozyma monospora TaxID=43982 RepID=A0ACB5U1T3_AMBMO|nr:unnamed protein product [Ambrosiozyma monospora]